jgi:hypothetical protein
VLRLISLIKVCIDLHEDGVVVNPEDMEVDNLLLILLLLEAHGRPLQTHLF